MNNRNLIIRIHELNTHFNYYSIRGSNIFFCNNSPLFEYQYTYKSFRSTELAFDRRRSRLVFKMIRYTVPRYHEPTIYHLRIRAVS